MTGYVGENDYRHDSEDVLGILVTNLGTPDAPTTSAVRRYLAEFLSDPRVVERPRWLWWLILHGIILRVRPRRSAAAYRKVWTDEGSPLLFITRDQAAALGREMSRRLPGPSRVAFAMRYGRPSIAKGLEQLRSAGARRLLVLPLYPQYSATTTASTFDAVSDVLRSWRWIPELRFVNHYHDHSGYVKAVAESIREAWKTEGQPDRLLFSFHGLPKSYLLAGDPYHCECRKTARLVAGELGLPEDRWQVSFQSRVGPEQWLQPYTDKTLQEWGRAGVGHVQVVCAGFSADCLETLEEIDVENRDYFLSAGGKRFNYIPALNTRPDHINTLASVIESHLKGWPEAEPDWNEERVRKAATDTLERARAMGAPR